MAELLYFILFVLGLLMVIKGSDWFIDSAVWAAEAFRIPSMIIGATIISICTTMPETFVSATAVLKGEPVMAVGNALGSIGVNIGLILAILMIASSPMIENRKEYLKSSLFLTFVTIFLWITGYFFGETSSTIGGVLVLLLFLYIANNIFSARKLMDLDIQYDVVDEEHVDGYDDPKNPLPEGVAYDHKENDFNISFQILTRKIIYFILGVGLVLGGSNLLVDNGIKIAEILHIPTIIVAVLFTSVGTSLPELITVITSIRKGVSNLGIGNIIGASILNIVQVIGISALIQPLPMSHEKSILLFHLPFILLMIISVCCFGFSRKGRLSKWNGIWLIALYLIYLTVNLLRDATPILGPLIY